MFRVTADDYGLSELVSQGIREAHLQGIVTDTSIMANMPNLESEVALLRDCPDLRCGVHLTLTEGQPLTGGARRHIADAAGMMSKASFLKGWLRGGQAFSDAVYGECLAQCQRLRDLGIVVEHIDSHHHVHVFPRVRTQVLRVARECSIRRIRASDDRDFLSQPTYWPIYLWSRTFRRMAQHQEFTVSQRFCGGRFLMRSDKAQALTELLHMYCDHDVELYCHPGYFDATLTDGYREERAAELAALINARRAR